MHSMFWLENLVESFIWQREGKENNVYDDKNVLVTRRNTWGSELVSTANDRIQRQTFVVTLRES
jgi:hypothetical protein